MTRRPRMNNLTALILSWDYVVVQMVLLGMQIAAAHGITSLARRLRHG
jgi:hypothetical protein